MLSCRSCAHRYCLSWSILFCPKFRRDAKLVRLLDQATDIVTNDFTQDFISHRDISLAPKVIPELRLNHGKCGLNVAGNEPEILRDEIWK
jgi:hypothetical protein